ncbi:acyl-CoA dehydratase activase [Moorella sulfitireducens (nom. illeg.)]|uniref:acyl-CoA dehydratase activase n=1 Tax=Neomoorella sulfitireducens TaxID=2972948 RepID=UPI0021AD3D29|nr:acyl-CoA dehydratase activase [Moorella sulfitireducens]
MEAIYLGIDVGSVSTNVVAIGESGQILTTVYLRTRGQPVRAIQEGLEQVVNALGEDIKVAGVGTTGSGRSLAAVMVGADVVKNEITAHAVAASLAVPGVQTVIEIGGQDSKIIILRHGIVTDFAMNTVCAAGTGSFLDQQAARLGIPIEEFGRRALEAKSPVRIAGRCAVFAESDMIHKQQQGHPLEDIIAGLCEALVRNYLNNVGKGKEILPPVVFQGGVAANAGMCRAFNRALGTEVIVPEHYGVMGAYGAALLAREMKPGASAFRGFELIGREFRTGGFECQGCANHCEVVELREGRQLLARWGDRCGKWSNAVAV